MFLACLIFRLSLFGMQRSTVHISWVGSVGAKDVSMFYFIEESKESNLAVLPEINISCCSSTDRGNLFAFFWGPFLQVFPHI